MAQLEHRLVYCHRLSHSLGLQSELEYPESQLLPEWCLTQKL